MMLRHLWLSCPLPLLSSYMFACTNVGIGFFSSLSSITIVEGVLRFLCLFLCRVASFTSSSTSRTSSSSLESSDKFPGVEAVALVTWAEPNMICNDSKLTGPHFLNYTCLDFLPFLGSLHLCNKIYNKLATTNKTVICIQVL
jgi:hypothetical protein